MRERVDRRAFLKQAALVTVSLSALPALSNIPPNKKKTILLCSSWQTFNIGDIAHTPGVLSIFERFLPDMKVMLWPHDVKNGVREILERRFPNISIVQGEQEVQNAFREADLFVHGSGPSLVGRRNMRRWSEETGKLYGVYGITFPGIYVARDVKATPSPMDIELLNNVAFVFFRDSGSLQIAREAGITCPIMEFGPDGTFAVDLQNEVLATAFLKDHGLEEGKFMCCIPCYRYTEEWLAKGKNRPYVQEHVYINNKMKYHDNGPLREAITRIIRETDMKILICPEDETHVALGKSLILDHLPEDVRHRVVWRDRYWLTDEVDKIVPTILSIAKDPVAAKRKALQAKEYVAKRQYEATTIIINYL